jgi:hypothetical protein
MATLQFNWITCLDQQERGHDELYMTFNGGKIPLSSMAQGETQQLLSSQYPFGESVLLNLFEDDGNHWYNRDDFIDSYKITDSPGHLTLDFIGNGAHYQMDVDIL